MIWKKVKIFDSDVYLSVAKESVDNGHPLINGPTKNKYFLCNLIRPNGRYTRGVPLSEDIVKQAVNCNSKESKFCNFIFIKELLKGL